MNSLKPADYIVFSVYFIAVSAYGYYVYRKKKTVTTNTKDFFLAEGSLNWWAIGASLAGKSNSISTIFSLDIYKKYFNKDASDAKVVRVGRWAVILCVLIAALVTPALKSLDRAYQFIQEYVGFFSPGVLAIFLLGIF